MSILQALKSAINPQSIATMLHDVMAGVHPTWTKDQADQAADKYVAFMSANGKSATALTMRDAFEAGAQWAKSMSQSNAGTVVHSVVTDLFGNNVAPVAEAVITGGLQIAGDLATGNTVKVVADVVQDLSAIVATPTPPIMEQQA
jgi:hypothetical protein